MATLERRIQILFSAEQASRLQAIARERGESVGSLVRRAVEETYLRHEKEARLKAVREMAAMSLPVGDWEQMERESVEVYPLE